MNERVLPDRDVAALVGVIAVLEGVIQAGEAESGIADRLRRRLQSDEYLPPGTSRGFNDEDVRQKLNDLNQRLRYVLREHDDPSASYPVWAPEVES